MVDATVEARPAFGSRVARGVRWGIAGAAPVVLILLVVWRWASVEAGTDVIGRADREWLVAAASAVVLTWLAGSCCQCGATPQALPVGRVFATQVAGSFINHVLPAGFGVAALNIRMLRRAGLTAAGATGAVGLNVAAGFVVHAVALVALLIAFGPHLAHLSPVSLAVPAGVALAAMALAAVLAQRKMRRGGRVGEHLTEVFALSRAVLRQPGRATMLWAGSLAIPVLHILILASVLRALHQPAPLFGLALIYLGASALSSMVPGPGGFGALDVALVAALTGAGTAAATAAAAVIGYRLLTVWIPLLPGAAIFLLLLHRRVV